VFENRVLRRIFGPKSDEVTGGWRKLHNKELHNLYSFPVIIRMIKTRRMTWAGRVARMLEERVAYRLLVEKTEGKNHWEDREIRWNGIDWIELAQDGDICSARVYTVIILRVS
jgi:hypothetical protein